MRVKLWAIRRGRGDSILTWTAAMVLSCSRVRTVSALFRMRCSSPNSDSMRSTIPGSCPLAAMCNRWFPSSSARSWQWQKCEIFSHCEWQVIERTSLTNFAFYQSSILYRDFALDSCTNRTSRNKRGKRYVGDASIGHDFRLASRRSRFLEKSVWWWIAWPPEIECNQNLLIYSHLIDATRSTHPEVLIGRFTIQHIV